MHETMNIKSSKPSLQHVLLR